jgi:uroporphyrinogen decarboxylase
MKFLTVFETKPVSPPPIWMMRQAGRYLPEYRETRTQAGDFLSLCLNPELATEVTLQPIRRFGFDASILFADILLIPHAMGQPLAYKEGVGPVLEPIRTVDGVARLAGDSAERLSPVYQTVRNLRAALPSDVALIGFAGAPWTVAAYMVEGRGGKGFVAARRWAFSDPQGFQTLIDKVTDATIHYLSAQIEAGADTIQIFDSWAGLLPASQLERWVIRPTRRIADALKARHRHIPVIGFPRGVGPAMAAYCAGTGVDGLSLDESLDPAWAVQAVPSTVVLQGNLDPQFVVAGGAPMLAEADRILDAFEGRPHIFNLGHGLVPETPPEHVGELVAHIRARAKVPRP